MLLDEFFTHVMNLFIKGEMCNVGRVNCES